jgi:hypothetical protein
MEKDLRCRPQMNNAYMRMKVLVLATRIHWKTWDFMGKLNEIHSDLYSLEKGWKEDPPVSAESINEKLKEISKEFQKSMDCKKRYSKSLGKRGNIEKDISIRSLLGR